ncbi:MAG: UDP-2,3-diacylglucosamine diphosphatase [Bacteroidetes bacterium]|nr:UDP-2,3-diacylglucosamine diphosphatase [Bacteroidota bacterium]HET6245140.1 UDP-2,3-diacylglucosamine diphosphatase [Bacteroidia bacterium]
MEQMKKYYFISDFHLGVPDYKSSLDREKKIVRWLDEIKNDAKEIYIMGDVFDFWFEYKTVVPKGYVRLLGKIAEICDAGIPVHFFTGNHDMWCFDYLPKELGVTIYRNPIEKEIAGKSFYLGHGDGLGPGDKGYKFIKKVFKSKFSHWMFGWVHPNLGIGIANFFSARSRKINRKKDEIFLGEENEWLVQFCKEELKKAKKIDYFIFGHRHLPLDIQLSENSRYINLGEWMNYCSYAVYDGDKLELKRFEQ